MKNSKKIGIERRKKLKATIKEIYGISLTSPKAYKLDADIMGGDSAPVLAEEKLTLSLDNELTTISDAILSGRYSLIIHKDPTGYDKWKVSWEMKNE